MLHRIQATAFRCFVPREFKEAKEGTATIFYIRRMSHYDATLYDIDLARVADRARTLDPENQSREAIDFRCGKFAQVCEKIENHEDGPEPITDPVQIKQYAIDCLTPEETEFLLGCSKSGTMLKTMDEEIAKNG
jgi:hypothetical protein